MGSGPVLHGEGLAKRYGDALALRGASLAIHRGESVAVMGPSGSGKSTLLYCLAGVLVADEGSVVFDGDRIDRRPDRVRSALRRSAFGFVFQFHGLLPELPAVENVAFPLMLNGLSRKEARLRAEALFEGLGIDGLERRRPGQLSGGQAQRVAIARALVIEPSVVFADEPTGSLDSRTGGQVMELLVDRVRDRNAALVVVTHDVRVAEQCDRTVEVMDGRTVTDGMGQA